MDILEMKEVSFSYKNSDRYQLQDISMRVKENKITALVGPNGSGKSTLFSCLTGENEIEKGEILFMGEDIYAAPLRELAQKMAVVYQSYHSRILLSVEDVVALGRTPYRKRFQSLSKEDTLFIDQAIESVGIENLRKRQLSELSGGQRQLVWLALALAQDPEVILLDEPTASLDIHNQKLFLNKIQNLNKNRGLTVCMILHDLNQVMRYCDYVYMLEAGRIVAQGPPETVLTEENIEKTYHVESERLLNSREEYVIDLY